MEEKQIREFVHRISQDEKFRKEFISNPNSIIMFEGFSPRVAQVLTLLVPYLNLTSLNTAFVLIDWT